MISSFDKKQIFYPWFENVIKQLVVAHVLQIHEILVRLLWFLLSETSDVESTDNEDNEDENASLEYFSESEEIEME